MSRNVYYGNQPLLWRTQLEHGSYVRGLTRDSHSLFVVLQQTMDPFARGRGQSVIHIDAQDGKVIQVSPLTIDNQAASLLADEPYLYVGGSENCSFVVHDNDVSKPLCYPRAKRWGVDTGQVLALYKNADNITAVTSSGYLQIWRKQDIVSSMTNK